MAVLRNVGSSSNNYVNSDGRLIMDIIGTLVFLYIIGLIVAYNFKVVTEEQAIIGAVLALPVSIALGVFFNLGGM